MSLSRLLSLPAEIRSLVWEFALSSDQLVTFRLDAFQRQYYSQAQQPPLLRVSRKLRNETLPIYYECNDFVLHTESSKADDGRRWLQANCQYLSLLRRINLWIRYVPLTNNRTSLGAIGITLFRSKKHDSWSVSPEWSWITTVRKPAELAGDAKLLLDKLTSLTESITPSAGPDAYVDLMSEIRLFYARGRP